MTLGLDRMALADVKLHTDCPLPSTVALEAKQNDKQAKQSVLLC